nr:Ribosome-binding protein 1 [Ipomoea batatas]
MWGSSPSSSILTSIVIEIGRDGDELIASTALPCNGNGKPGITGTPEPGLRKGGRVGKGKPGRFGAPEPALGGLGKPGIGKPEKGKPIFGVPELELGGLLKPGMGKPENGKPIFGVPEPELGGIGKPGIGKPGKGKPGTFGGPESELGRIGEPGIGKPPKGMFEDGNGEKFSIFAFDSLFSCLRIRASQYLVKLIHKMKHTTCSTFNRI